jgi:hypothetical protein
VPALGITAEAFLRNVALAGNAAPLARLLAVAAGVVCLFGAYQQAGLGVVRKPSSAYGVVVGLLMVRAIQAPAPTTAARASAMRLVCTHVRQALQQTVAVGACSPYFAALLVSLPCHSVFIASSVSRMPEVER